MSADQRRDRTGELPVIGPDEPCGCDGGWIDRDADQPIACTRCRPHLAVRRRVRGGWSDVR